MSRRYVAYYPLVLALLFGVAISFIPVSPALSDNIGACRSAGNSSSHLTLGGRVITPSLLLQANSGQPCPVSETSLSLVSLSRTIIVSPNGTPTQNGTALLTAMTTIFNGNPSGTNPWLLKLEPGQYDLGSSVLTLLPYVDLEGSGEDTTFISSTVGASALTTGTLVLASHTQARFLSVANAGSQTDQIAVYIPANVTNASLVHLTATASGGVDNSMGLYSAGNAVIVQNSTLTGANGGKNSTGFDNAGTATVQTGIFTGTSLTGQATGGIINSGSGVITVQNSILTGSGGMFTTGFANSGDGATATVQSSILTASGGSTVNAGFFSAVGGSISNIQNSTLTATGASSYGFFVGASGTFNKIATSELSGTNGTASGSVTCVGSYNANFVALGPNCL